jgi:hypothetical protein
LAGLSACAQQPSSTEEVVARLGEFHASRGSNDILVAAPHGSADRNTGAIAVEAAKRLHAASLVAMRFSAEKRINVNRPTEGAGLRCAEEPQTERARHVFDAYAGRVKATASKLPIGVYVEIHGNSLPATANHLEIATKGLSREQALRVKAAYPGLLSRVREATPDYPELVVLLEPADRIHWGAACNKRLGILALPEIARALHFEFPAAAREPAMLRASAQLAEGIIREAAK